MATNKVVIEAELDTKSFDSQIEQVKGELDALDTLLSQPHELSGDDLIRYKAEAEKLRNKLVSLNEQKEKLNQTDISGLKKAIDGVGNSVKGVANSVVKWGLALFGIRGAYSLIRQAMSTISSENEQISNDIAYMKWVLAQTLKPVVEWIVNALYTVLALVNSISMSLFGFNLLAGKSAEAFKQSKKNIGGMASGLKDAKKQLAGFDEMNVLSDTSSSGGGGAGGGIDDWNMPDMDKYSKTLEKAKKSWMDFGKEMKFALEEVPLSAWIDGFGAWGIALYGITEIVYGLWEIIQGFIEFCIGLIEIVVGLITGDTEKVKKGIYDMLEGLWKFIDGIIRLVIGLVDTLVGIVIGLIAELIDAILVILKGLWDGIKFIFSVVGSWVYEHIIKPIADFFVGLWNGIVNGVKTAIQLVKDIFNGVVNFFKNIVSKIIELFKAIGTNVGNVVGGAFKGVINGVLGAIESILNFPIKSINKLIDVINKVPGINLGKLSTFNLPRLAKGGIVNNPGPGVMMGSYIAGEKGPEAVLPLTDDTLQRLANMIPITVNLTNTMNGRVISRELKKVQNESNFAYNR